MRPQPIKIEWEEESLLKALNLVIDEQNFSRLRKGVMKRKLFNQYRRGTLCVENLNTEWLYRLCAASLMLRNYNWYGWEWRSKWAAALVSQPWAYPRWDGDRTKRLLVVAEQGLGDEIVFASCYNDLAADVEEAWIECDPRLIPIFERSFPPNLHFVSRFLNDERRVIPRMNDYPDFHREHGIEAFIMAGNVPKLYRRSREDFPSDGPNLRSNKDYSKRWNDWLERQFPEYHRRNVPGWSWKGRQGEIPYVEWGISLQYGEGDHGNLRVPPMDLKWDIDELFALISCLPRVITTTNAVAHIAGSLGVQAHVIKPAPIFATKEDGFNNRVQAWWPNTKSDWYPSVTMYRSWQEWQAKNL